MIVADASVIIALAKMRRLELLREVYSEVVLVPAVKTEVLDQGKAILAPGVERVEDAVQKGWIQIARLKREEKLLAAKILKNSCLGEGEAQSLALAHSRKLMVILDDKEARAHADLLDLEYVGTAGVLLEGFLGGHLTFQQLEEDVQDLSRTIWLSPAVVAEILKRAREVKK